MRVFVTEYICGGGWPGDVPSGSLAAEGRAMLLALVADFARVPRVRVETTWDARLADGPGRHVPALDETVRVWSVNGADEEWQVFRHLAAECDATCVIAPEFQGILAQRCGEVDALGGRLLGPNSAAVRFCADKLDLAQHLISSDVPTIETHPFHRNHTPAVELPFPVVIKPRDGAGSQATYLVRDGQEYVKLRSDFAAEPLLQNAIWQPYTTGRAVSVAMLVDAGNGEVDVFPPCEQHLSAEGRFRYLGGTLPARNCDPTAIRAIAQRVAGTISGLKGYIGMDLIIPASGEMAPRVVEINPRLTTSYLGYRALTADNLAERMLDPQGSRLPLNWGKQAVHFTPAGVE